MPRPSGFAIVGVSFAMALSAACSDSPTETAVVLEAPSNADGVSRVLVDRSPGDGPERGRMSLRVDRLRCGNGVARPIESLVPGDVVSYTPADDVMDSDPPQMDVGTITVTCQE